MRNEYKQQLCEHQGINHSRTQITYVEYRIVLNDLNSTCCHCRDLSKIDNHFEGIFLVEMSSSLLMKSIDYVVRNHCNEWVNLVREYNKTMSKQFDQIDLMEDLSCVLSNVDEMNDDVHHVCENRSSRWFFFEIDHCIFYANRCDIHRVDRLFSHAYLVW